MVKYTITAPRTGSNVRIGRAVWLWLRTKVPGADYSFDGGHVRVSAPFDGRAGADALNFGLAALTAWNVRALEDTPLPPLYSAGVVYDREPMCRYDSGEERICEEWLTAHAAYARRKADCDDLGGWRAAELRLQGEAATPLARPSAAGWHIIVRRGDGSIEDPSAKLGMPTS
jgi:hypothetical protein